MPDLPEPIDRESNIQFHFPPDVKRIKLDTCKFREEELKHAKNLIRMKCVDFAVWEPSSKTLWLLEVKNFTHPKTEPPDLLELSASLVKKVWDSFALLHLAQYAAQAELEEVFPIAGYNLRLAFHLEFDDSNALFDAELLLSNLLYKLEQSLPVMDGQFVVYSCKDELETALPWQYSK